MYLMHIGNWNLEWHPKLGSLWFIRNLSGFKVQRSIYNSSFKLNNDLPYELVYFEFKKLKVYRQFPSFKVVKLKI